MKNERGAASMADRKGEKREGGGKGRRWEG
jgi:hypothetical protein